MDIKVTLEKRVSAKQGDFATARGNQASIRKPLKSLVAFAFGLLLTVPGLTQTQDVNADDRRVLQYRFIPIDVPGATRTSVNGNSTHEIVGDYDDAAGNTHGFVLNKGVFTTIDAPGAEGGTIINGRLTKGVIFR